MIHPATAPSPKSRMMKAMTDPAATTTNTWAMMLNTWSLEPPNGYGKVTETYAKQVQKTTTFHYFVNDLSNTLLGFSLTHDLQPSLIW